MAAQQRICPSRPQARFVLAAWGPAMIVFAQIGMQTTTAASTAAATTIAVHLRPALGVRFPRARLFRVPFLPGSARTPTPESTRLENEESMGDNHLHHPKRGASKVGKQNGGSLN